MLIQKFNEQGQVLTIADGLVCLSLSLRISFSMLSLIASLHARWQISVRSAPEKPLVIFARKSKSTSYKVKYNFLSLHIFKGLLYKCHACLENSPPLIMIKIDMII